MKVCLYTGSLKVIAKSGIGQAVLHQHSMLENIGAEITTKIKKDTEIVHLNTVFPDSVKIALLARLCRKRVIYYGHSTMEDFCNSFKLSNFFAPMFKVWIKFCYSLGDVIITPTDYSKKILESYGIKTPIYALSNGVDTDFFAPSAQRRQRFRSKYHLLETEKAVLSVGHYIERKGILDFIELAQLMPNVHFFWFGYTNKSLIPALIRNAIQNAPSNLIFPGYVDRDELCDAYCGCDLFDFMSYEETEGIVVLEALASGIPTIIRNIPVYEEWLNDKVNVYKANCTEHFYTLTSAILSGNLPNLSKQEIATAKQRSLKKTACHLMALYQSFPQKKRYIGGN